MGYQISKCLNIEQDEAEVVLSSSLVEVYVEVEVGFEVEVEVEVGVVVEVEVGKLSFSTHFILLRVVGVGGWQGWKKLRSLRSGILDNSYLVRQMRPDQGEVPFLVSFEIVRIWTILHHILSRI